METACREPVPPSPMINSVWKTSLAKGYLVARSTDYDSQREPVGSPFGHEKSPFEPKTVHVLQKLFARECH